MAAGKRERPAEDAVAAFGPVFFLLGRFAGGMPLALDRQQAVRHGDLYLVGLDAGNLDRHPICVPAFGYVDRRPPGRAFALLTAPPAAPPDHARNAVSRGARVPGQSPARHRSHGVPLVSGRAIGPATRKNTAQVNTIHIRDTLFTLQ